MKTQTFLFVAVLQASPGFAESPLLSLPSFPDFVMVGVGAGPQYIGSDDQVWAAAPAGQWGFGHRYVSLQANYLNVNLINDPNWSAGPAGILRFGRTDVEDDAVDALPEIPMSIGLGAFVGYSFAGGEDPRNRWRIGAGVLQDATSPDQGFVADVNVRRWLPVGEHAAMGIGLASSWASEDYMDTYFSIDSSGAAASGLPVYSAGEGWRDVRLTALFVQPVSRKWAIGTGFMYSYLLDDAAGSGVVRTRDQVYAGVGLARLW
ncbi:MipA/OmpV family protein [Pseudoruegeria sp. SK021]|uniref:MipA/OmpV family protein n=1 Tax=Pseudoruegeria sp. SK021 TaxID=1933035 RepID=UPI000A26408F|nr:MipA/OmpV family protein [Pseudoruegeria sp. SK021]OSP55836.1 hypothetical protein BV911_05550 [Pseudoruegeria sp. SK021]